MRPSHPLLLALAACSVACATPPVAAPAPVDASAPVRLTLVGINDFHGHVEPHRTRFGDGQVLEEGGAATLSAYVQALREDNPGGVLLLDGGDLFQGTLASNLTEGAIVVDVYNHLGFTAAAVGNHEFDYGPVGPAPMASGSGEDPLGALKARVRQARFPFLSANLRDAATGKVPEWLGNDGTHLVTVKGVRVGVLGLSTESTPSVTNPANVESLRFAPLASSASEAARSLRERGADVVVAVAHAGGKCADLKDPRDTSSCERGGDAEIIDMLEKLPPGTLDAVVAGHTHQTMGHFIAGVPVIETTGLARSVGVVELFVDPVRRRVDPSLTRIQAAIPLCTQVEAASGACDGRKVVSREKGTLVPAEFLGRRLVQDAAVQALLAPTLAQVEATQGRASGVACSAPLSRGYTEEGALGNVIADALREAAGADVAVMNPGGIRADLPGGPLSFGHVYQALPFDNTVALLTLTGDELRRLLELAHSWDRGMVFAVSGLELTLARCPGPTRLRAVTLTGGIPLEPTRSYRVALPDFLARGGDGLDGVTRPLPPERTVLAPVRGMDLRQALIAYGQSHGGVLPAPSVGRVRYSGVATTCPTASR
ncbi:5'-nucleotidase C-terminal domain-containing protein [Myxococcus sp. K15C18031901]|uniref:bifunctional metallophosphatase/5'-nucleotidase n=1 Tax=Myxococcus dinghuensis TaxID=2906761 RepID=UPI0020A77E08|nr:5'-nucleotidase C-terminal domain-containing protein [Myxococcus dinghuensis]MCP3098720.1 5'-nucleotidase C-terminal domain-containing protein [Myxococcus dinghuensis]